MDVIGYARVVPAERTEEALAHQKARIESFCSEQGHQLVGFFTEVISAEVPIESRTELMSALRECGKNRYLIVIRLDRLGSNKKILAKVFERCEADGVNVIPVAGPKTWQEMPNALEITHAPG